MIVSIGKSKMIIVYLLLLLMGAIDTNAQEMIIKDFYIVPGDKTAETNPRVDNGNNPCALVKIKTNNISGLSFTNANQYVGAVAFKDGIYYVYVPTITRRIAFAHDNYHPGTLELADFGYSKGLKGGKTYEAVFEAPDLKTGATGVSFKVNPCIPGTKIVLDGKVYQLMPNQIIKIDCSQGTHHYTVEADRYVTETGNVQVSDGYVPLNITLRQKTKLINFDVTPLFADVYIDNVNYGKTGNLHIPIGRHTLRLVAKDYLDYTTTIDVTSDMDSFTYRMSKNTGRTIDIHALPVKIYCESSRLYKNNKLLKEWSNGSKIMFMPGTSCKLTDDEGHGAVLKVGYTPMTIKISGNSITVLSSTSADYELNK